MPDSYPPAPWSQAQLLNQGIGVNTQLKPAMCDFNGRLFLAWATWADFGQASTFSFTRWSSSDNGWEAPTNVLLDDSSTTQSYTSALAVYNNVLYAFVPYASQSDSSTGGLSIFKYSGTTFVHVCNWGNTWNTSVTAAVCDGVLHVVGYNQNNSDHFVWTWTNANLQTITASGDFSDNAAINESTTSNPALFVRDGKLRLLFLASGDSRGVLEDTLTMGNNPPWVRTDTLNESGNSGVSGASTPDGKRAWICFKTHNGYSNLICHYKRKNNANCWSSNRSMGSGEILEALHEAALACSGDWLYAVWNTYQTNGLM